ncbi:hypothetical protein [Sellimonas intestinalis]|uniref:hypothetical protein n=1 Tax=Sellimonas intestinalis TaxID=1653434 RepID=UPI0022DF14A7|nr:hypothetical protein [Sellimonas intestinalis]
MDKYEYREKTEQIMKYVQTKSYDKAKEIAETIDWKRVKNASMLCTVSEIYEYTGEYQKSREILFIAYDRSPGSRKIVYRLGTLALRLGETEEALDCYEEFVSMAPKDPNQYILKYKILKAQNAPLKEQIRVLEEFKKAEYIEKWAYELAELYDKAGMTTECLEECDDLILWFSDGVFVQKAMELKIKYKPLTPQQQQKYRTPETEEKSQAGKPAAVETAQEEELEKKGEILEGQASQGQTAKEEPDQSQEIQPEPEKLVDVGQVISMLQDDDKRDALIRKLDMSRALTGVFLLGMAVGGNQTIEEVTHMLGKGEGDVYETGQMRIEEILRQWEERQRKNAAAIEEKKKEAEEKAAKERAKAEKVSKDTATILSEDIQRLLNEMESEEKGSQEEMGGTTESIARLSESMKEQPEETVSQEEPAEEEIMEETVGETEEAGEEEEEYEEDEYDEDEYEEEEYDEDEYEDEYEDVSEDEFEEEYDEGEYDDEESDFEEDDFGYDDEEIEDEETEEEEPTKLETEEVLEIEEPDEDDSSGSSGGSSFDTGFIVQGRYDLSATSEIGLKLGLTEEQKKLFSYFVPIRGMSEQLVDVLEQDKVCKKRYGTSRTGNILVIGHKGSGKTVLAVDIVKAIQKQRRMKQGKVAIITGDALNKKNLISIIQKLSGGALIIEKASKMNDKTIDDLTGLMEEQTGEMLFILEDERRPMEKMLSEYPDFRRKFTSRVELPIFINDELVTFGQTYAKENGYRIDEMGILALYSRIDVLQKEDHFVTVAEVKDIMDDAIEHSQKANVKHLMKRVFGKSTDETDRIILKEDDFKH